MNTTDNFTDEALLEALAQRLSERHEALEDAHKLLNELRALNLKLEAAEQLKGRFLSNIRNEINNPLTALRGFAAAIASNPELAREQVTEMAAAMHREASDLSFQMENIFVAADFEAGSVAPDVTHVQVNRLIAETIDDVRLFAEGKGIEITTCIAEEHIVITDAAKLGQLLANLLRNAIEFARKKVRVSLSRPAEMLVLDVEDDGPGIPAQESERVFDRFVQLSEGSTKSHPGHGLGLSVARACADLIGGAIEVVEGPGVGAHFRVQFPADEVAAGGESAEASNEFLFDVLETF